MGRKGLVTIGTDGNSDYVQLSDGVRYMLGSVSILKFVTELSQGVTSSRHALSTFMSDKKAMLTVDLDRMHELLAPRRPRHSSVIKPLIKSSDWISQESDHKRILMADTSLAQQISKIEGHVATLMARPKSASTSPETLSLLTEDVKGLVASITASEEEEAGENQRVEQGKEASFDTLSANAELAETILACVDESNTTIDRLASEGKRFDAPKAKQDLHRIASKVSEIAQNVDLAQPWVKKDLAFLAKHASEIHDIFHS